MQACSEREQFHYYFTDTTGECSKFMSTKRVNWYWKMIIYMIGTETEIKYCNRPPSNAKNGYYKSPQCAMSVPLFLHLVLGVVLLYSLDLTAILYALYPTLRTGIYFRSNEKQVMIQFFTIVNPFKFYNLHDICRDDFLYHI